MPANSMSNISMTTHDYSPYTKGGETIALETRFLTVDDGHIAYDDTGGDGPLIVAIPGMGDLRSEYRLLRPILPQAG